MKNSRDDGFGQHYNGQVAVEEGSRLVVGFSLSNHANDCREAAPTVESIPETLGPVPAAALDTGYFSQTTIDALEARQIEPYIATGRHPHNQGFRAFFAEAGAPPTPDAGLREKMAHKLRTAVGKAIYRRRKRTVEPVIGIIKETMGFRQFSLRGQQPVAGEWLLVCLAYNLRRLHVLHTV